MAKEIKPQQISLSMLEKIFPPGRDLLAGDCRDFCPTRLLKDIPVIAEDSINGRRRPGRFEGLICAGRAYAQLWKESKTPERRDKGLECSKQIHQAALECKPPKSIKLALSAAEIYVSLGEPIKAFECLSETWEKLGEFRLSRETLRKMKKMINTCLSNLDYVRSLTDGTSENEILPDIFLMQLALEVRLAGLGARLAKK